MIRRKFKILINSFFLLVLLIILPFNLIAEDINSNSANINSLLQNGEGVQFDNLGVNCGIPDSDINKCCTYIKGSENLIANEVDQTPDLVCMPQAVSSVFNAIGGIFKTAFNTVAAIPKAATGLVTGNLEATRNAVITPVKNVADTIKNIGKKNCFTDLAKAGMIKATNYIPFADINQLDSPDTPCIENAVPTSNNYTSSSCTCVYDEAKYGELCNKYITSSDEKAICLQCASNKGIWTGIGCIQTSLSGFVGSIFSFGIGLAGLITFLCILYSAYLIQFSAGNPERIKKAKQNLTSCIVGLLIIIFSIFILKIIGVNILRLPGIS